MIILASESPRRKELLRMCNIDFEVSSSNIDENKIVDKVVKENENLLNYELAKKITERLAYEKASYVFSRNSSSIVIGSDTIVVTEDDGILGKPKDYQEAKNMLYALCGKIHRVYTSVCILSDSSKEIFTSYTEVEFFEIDEDMDNIIDDYLKTGSPLDKAGAYGIQDMGGLLVKELRGDYYTVVGLPIAETYRKVKKLL